VEGATVAVKVIVWPEVEVVGEAVRVVVVASSVGAVAELTWLSSSVLPKSRSGLPSPLKSAATAGEKESPKISVSDGCGLPLLSVEL